MRMETEHKRIKYDGYAYRYVCCHCGELFDEPDEYQENIGEFWGTPAYETFTVCPFCGNPGFEEFDEQQYLEDEEELEEEENAED